MWRMGQQPQEELGQEEVELEEISLKLRSSPPPPREQSPQPSAGPDSCHGRVIRNQQNLFPIFLLLP